MFKTKKDVDRHVRTALSKLKSENEKNLRGFPIAKLYYKINEYSTAQHYISGFLSVREDSAPAHKLLGQCYLHLKKPDKALASFQRSLQLDPKQHDLLIEVCKLLLADNSINPNKAKYWCDLAEAEKVQHDAVFSLRLKLLNKDSLETKQVEELILKEISSRPNDVNLRVRLVRHFVEQDKIMDAFKYAFGLQMKNADLFANSGEWHNVVGLILNKYKMLTNIQKGWDFWLLLIICCEKQVEISFSITADSMPNAGTTETANLLFNFDQCLFEASRCVLNLCQERELAVEFLRHYRGQLCLYAAALLFKREIVQNKNQWQETTKNALPLLMLAFQCSSPDTQELWLKHSRDQTKQLIQLWNREGAFRCSQAGRTLLSCIETQKSTSVSSQVQQILSESRCWSSTDDILAQVRQYCSDNAWRSKLFRVLFPNSDHIIKMQSSFLINAQQLAEPNYEIPSYADVETYEEIAQYLRPQSLQHMVYLCLGSENLADVRCKFFSGLNFSTQNLAFCGAESLNQLDIETFLYATAIQAQRALDVEKAFSENYDSKCLGKPRILPFVNIVSNLCTEEQITWWMYAYQVYKNLASDNLGEMRTTLQYGIEAVRGINGPKIDLIIVLKLGKIFVMRTQDAIRPLEKNFLEARAENLYKYGLNMLKLHNKGVLEPYRKLFKYSNSNSSQVEREINALAEEAVTHLAARYFKNAEYEECIEELSGIQLPFATYFQAEAYRKLDESNKTPKKTKKIYLDKARDCLNQTLTLLNNSNINANHPLNSVVHSEIKRLQFTNNFTGDSFSNGPYSESVDDFLNETSTLHNNRIRRNDVLSSSPRSVELENLVKQMASTLTFLKEELIDVIKPEITGITKEMCCIKEKLEMIEESMNKKSTPPSRDDDPHDLGDLYNLDDELQSQIYGNQQNIYSNYTQQQQQIQQPQRMHTPNAMINQPSQHHPPTAPHLQQTQTANAYNNQMYNPTYSMNYFPQYVMPGPHPPPQALPTTQRSALGLNQHSIPFVDHTLNFNLSGQQPPPQHMQLPPSDNRSNLFGLLTQTTNTQDKFPANQPVTSSTPGMWNRLYNNGPVEKGPPVNVVITSSDPLPTNTTSVAQPTLSVTIPPQHIKPSIVSNEPSVQQSIFMQHNTNFPIITSTIPSISTFTATTLSPISIESTTPKSKTDILKSPEELSNKTSESDIHNRSTDSDYDPRPDFKPVIPLPKEIEVKTGEEDEEVLFCARAKLFRYVDKEWKERGVGDMKILKNKNDDKIRILMRREHTHKICANHIITAEMNLSQAKNEDKSYIWAANDFADEELKVEKLCVRFKQVETAKEFYNVFMKARDEAKKGSVLAHVEKDKKECNSSAQITTNPLSKTPTFNFNKSNTQGKPESSTTSDTPTHFNSKSPFAISTPSTIGKNASNENKSSPFANFTFKPASSGLLEFSKPFADSFSLLNKSQQSDSTSTPSGKNQITIKPTNMTSATKKDETLNKSVSDTEDDYVPTAQFKPVIPLPDLIEVQTGEENEIVLFEHRAKLLRYDKQSSEWKERGIGNIKILVDKNDKNLVRLVMRREIIHKLCCNQRLTKDMKFKKAPNTDCALSWYGQDFSENELNTDIFTIRFKTAEICNSFHEAIMKAQADMSDEIEETKADDKNSSKEGFGSQFKPKPGSWNCSACYLQNIAIAKECIACGSLRDKANIEKVETVKKPESSQFIFAVSGSTGNKAVEGFGDKFKAKPGTWNCSSCYVQNEGTIKKCIACGAPYNQDGAKKGEETKKDENAFSFSASVKTTDKNAAGFGDKFKPKPGSWACKECYVSNTEDSLYCVACANPKDDTVPKKNSTENNIFGNIGINAPKTKFSFGFSPNTPATDFTTVDSSKNSSEITTAPSKFTFGLPNSAATVSDVFQPSSTTTYTFGKTTSTPAGTGFTFGFTTSTSSNTNKTETPTFSTSSLTTTSISSQPSTLPSFSFCPPPASIFDTSKSADSNKTSDASVSVNSAALSNMPKQSADQAGDIFKLEKKEFNFVLKPKSPGKAKSPLKSGGEDESDGENVEEENNTYFTPVIPLPDKVEVKTGEENEETLYIHRAKLYRFAESDSGMEWKERGLGNVKILRHRETKKLRVVMRREQIHKICLNHVLNADVDYKRKDDKSWHFIVNDFSEGEIEKMHFALRFKNKEIAEKFMDAVKKAISGELHPIKDEESTERQENISERGRISAEDEELAGALQLSPNFFNVCSGECSGCRGCDPDKFVFPEYKDVNKELIDDNPLPLELEDLSATSKAKSSILKQKSTEESKNKENDGKFVPGGFLFGNASAWDSAEKAKPIFGGGNNIFSSSTNPFSKSSEQSTDTFSFGAKPTKSQQQFPFGNNSITTSATNTSTPNAPADNAKESTKNIFGNNSISNSKESGQKFLFGSTPLFGSAATKPFAEVTPTFGSAVGGNIFGGFGIKKAGDSDLSSIKANEVSADNSSSVGLFKSTDIFPDKPTIASTKLIESEKTGTTTSIKSAVTKDTPSTFDKFTASSEDNTRKESENPPETLFKLKEDISFASLAQSGNNSTFKTKENTARFIGLTNTNAFSSFLSSQTDKDKSLSTSNVSQGDSTQDDSNCNDPYYEPIISLPKEIELKTGEEDEQKLFGERGILFRYDNNTKEWKERGIGEMKILYHPEKGTYRFLLRREQVHKLVLNHAITSNFNLAPMGQAGKAFLWAAQNFAEEPAQLEKLAIRFKNDIIGKRFEDEVNNCIEELKKRADLEPEDD